MSAPPPTDWAAILEALDDENASVRRDAAEMAVAALFLGPGPAEAFAVFERGLSDPSLEVQALCGRAAVLMKLDTNFAVMRRIAATVRRVYAAGSEADRRVVETSIDDTVEALESLWRFPRCFQAVLGIGLTLTDQNDRLDAIHGLVEIEFHLAFADFPIERLGPVLEAPMPAQLQKRTIEFVGRARKGGADLTPLVPTLLRTLESKTPFVAYHCGRLLVAQAIDNDDPTLVAEIAGHPNGEVRQGAMEALHTASYQMISLTLYTTILGEAIDDACGGVEFYALRALEFASRSRNFVLDETIIPVLRRALQRPEYHAVGWIGNGLIFDTDILRGNGPSDDAQTILSRIGASDE